MKLFLEAKVDTSRKDDEGQAAHHLAAFFGLTDVVKALLEKVDITLKDNEGRTALYLAVFGYTEVVKLLEEVKAAANDRGGYILEATVKRVRQP